MFFVYTNDKMRSSCSSKRHVNTVKHGEFECSAAAVLVLGDCNGERGVWLVGQEDPPDEGLTLTHTIGVYRCADGSAESCAIRAWNERTFNIYELTAGCIRAFSTGSLVVDNEHKSKTVIFVLDTRALPYYQPNITDQTFVQAKELIAAGNCHNPQYRPHKTSTLVHFKLQTVEELVQKGGHVDSNGGVKVSPKLVEVMALAWQRGLLNP